MSSFIMITLEIKERGKESNFALRSSHKVPAIIYGGNKEPVKITLDGFEMRKVYQNPHYFTGVIKLNHDGQSEDVLAKDVQTDPVTGEVIHADFMRVDSSQKIRVHVPVRFINDDKSPAIKRGGVLNIVVHALEVRSSPYNIPHEFTYDLTGLRMQDDITLDKIELPADVHPVHPKRDHVLATIVAPTGLVEETEKSE